MPALLRRCLVVLFSLATARIASAQDQPPIARVVPPGPNPAHVFILDSAHILSPGTIAALQDSARSLQTETQADVAWVTLPTLEGRAIEEAALYIGRTWRIGSAGKPGDPLRNRGLVVLFVPDKRTTAGSNFRIEVGNGLEGTITDSRSRSISAAMREGLRAKHYDAAYLAGWAVAASLVREDFASHGIVATPPQRPPAPEASSDGLGLAAAIPVLMVLAILSLLMLASFARRRAVRRAALAGGLPLTSDDSDDDARRRSSWSSFDTGSSSSSDSSSSSSDGGSFGDGGGFSGGGSSDTI
jgi:uncharacterized protein